MALCVHIYICICYRSAVGFFVDGSDPCICLSQCCSHISTYALPQGRLFLTSMNVLPVEVVGVLKGHSTSGSAGNPGARSCHWNSLSSPTKMACNFFCVLMVGWLATSLGCIFIEPTPNQQRFDVQAPDLPNWFVAFCSCLFCLVHRSPNMYLYIFSM